MSTESELAFRSPLLKTPFHERQRPLSQIDSFIPWAGYTTVDVFTSVEQEYFAIRNAASLYDLTPMVKYRVHGPDATRYLDRLMTRNIGRLAPGRVAYTVWCNDSGHVIDDGTVFCLDAGDLRLCTAERQLDWLLDAAIGFQVEVSEITAQIAALALQGPTSCAVLKAAGIAGVEQLKPFAFSKFAWPGLPSVHAEVLISRTGFTGDLGYELWLAPEAAVRVWDALMAAGSTRGIRPVGSRALNIARIEAGFLAPNVDFVNAEHTLRVGTARTPLELGLEWLIDFDKGHFTGRRALLAQQRGGVPRRLVGLDVAGSKPAVNALLYADPAGRRQVGAVTSAAWAPTAKRNVALAMIEAPHFGRGAALWAEIYLNRELVWERRMVRARVVERTFFNPLRRHATPARDC
jgi:aminomethyltransferase